MKHHAAVIGHADADGHLIAEQVRRNLVATGAFNVRVVVDPERTKDHKAWTKLESLATDVADADYVFFVDLMFGPESFAEEAGSLLQFVGDRPDKRFFVVDHHPLPLRRLSDAKNLHTAYRPDVFDCVVGPRSGMMVVAALCEHQKSEVADVLRPVHTTLAEGMRRAAALGGDLPGPKLLALLKGDRWDALLQLGSESSEYHYLPRGRRPAGERPSKALRLAEDAAADVLHHPAKYARSATGRMTMSYDADIGHEKFTYSEENRRVRNAEAPSRDLEAIVTLLEVAAMSLSSGPESTFSRAALVAEARDIGGPEISLDERDIDIILKKARFVEKVGKEFRLR